MKELTNYITEANRQLSEINTIKCLYLIKGIQASKDKMQTIEDLELMLNKEKKLKEHLIQYIQSLPNQDIPQFIGNEDAAALYNYIMAVNIEKINN